MISIIVALGDNGVIGKGGSLPWPVIKVDFSHFYQLTRGKPVVMGRKTFLSLGKLLPQRKNIVLTSKLLEVPGGVVAHSIKEVLDQTQMFPEVMIIGGASVYGQFLPLAEKMYLTIIHAQFKGDVFFPQYSEAEWEEQERVDYPVNRDNPLSFSFVTLMKK